LTGKVDHSANEAVIKTESASAAKKVGGSPAYKPEKTIEFCWSGYNMNAARDMPSFMVLTSAIDTPEWLRFTGAGEMVSDVLPAVPISASASHVHHYYADTSSLDILGDSLAITSARLNSTSNSSSSESPGAKRSLAELQDSDDEADDVALAVGNSVISHAQEAAIPVIHVMNGGSVSSCEAESVTKKARLGRK
jgi:hypothetical protein